MKTLILLLSLGLGAYSAWADNPPIDDCQEGGPYYSSTCDFQGSLISGALTYTNLSVWLGQPITAPVATNIAFSNGQQTDTTSWDCPWPNSSSSSHAVTYTPSSYFTPPIPEVIWVPGAYYFTNVVVANTIGMCPSFNTNLATVVITVTDNYWGSCLETNYLAPPGLVSWWRAEGNGSDYVGTNNGLLQGGVTYAAGEVGQAFSFNGADGDVQVPASATLNVGQSNGLTIEGWINPADAVARPIADWSPNGACGALFWANMTVAGALYADLFDTGGVHHVIQSAGGLIATNSFQHVAVTYDKTSGIAQLWLNGAVVQQANLGSFTPQTSYALNIGYRLPGASYGPVDFLGQIDELSLYSRALTTNEIQTIYAAGSAGKFSMGYWRFDTNTWAGVQGQLPLSSSNVQSVLSTNWGNNVLQVDSNNPAWLRYRTVETNGLQKPNITPQCGTVRFWFKPDWNSTTTNNGTGPQSEGRLIEIGSQTNNNGWWGLILNPNGTQISFLTQSNSVTITNLTAAINWTSNAWHQIVLTYCPTKSCLYLDGQAVITNGWGMTLYPNAADRANGFGIGSDNVGANQARGQFKNLETFAYPLDAASAGNGDSDGNGIPDWWEMQYFNYVGVNPNADPDGDGLTNLQEYQAGTNPNLAILTQPQSQTVFSGSTVTFAVVAGGATPRTIQWYFNGTPITDATGTNLVLSGVQAAAAGNYTVTVSNRAGTITSAAATLDVACCTATELFRPAHITGQ